MTAPFFGDASTVGRVSAIAIGIAFGASLEQAGLGDSRVLRGQFQLRDFTVLKVMLSAIVTAMLGTFWLDRVGLLDLGRVYVPETFLLPQGLGGLVFGVGFSIAGLCPGTACAAAAIGRRDGALVMAGMVGGMVLTSVAYPWLAPIADMTPRGAYTLADATGVPRAALVYIVVLLALGTFHLVERQEQAAATRMGEV